MENNRKDIEKLYDHAKVANEEMGVVKEKITLINAKIENIDNHVTWIHDIYDSWEKRIDKIDNRVWYILTTIIIGFLITITINLYK